MNLTYVTTFQTAMPIRTSACLRSSFTRSLSPRAETAGETGAAAPHSAAPATPDRGSSMSFPASKTCQPTRGSPQGFPFIRYDAQPEDPAGSGVGAVDRAKELGAVGDAEAAVEAGQLGFDRLHAEVEGGGDLAVGGAVADHGDDLLLVVSEFGGLAAAARDVEAGEFCFGDLAPGGGAVRLELFDRVEERRARD